jgi:hypothetical protein
MSVAEVFQIACKHAVGHEWGKIGLRHTDICNRVLDHNTVPSCLIWNANTHEVHTDVGADSGRGVDNQGDCYQRL